jgi:hypothetical protein
MSICLRHNSNHPTSNHKSNKQTLGVPLDHRPSRVFHTHSVNRSDTGRPTPVWRIHGEHMHEPALRLSFTLTLTLTLSPSIISLVMQLGVVLGW